MGNKHGGKALAAKSPPEINSQEASMISIVDDDESVRESTKTLVRSFGYAARAFASAEEFLGSDIEATRCLILDVHMKGLSGIDLQRRLIAEGRATRVIFMTAFPDERIRAAALNAGAIAFLSKPFSDERLWSCIGAALTGSGTNDV